MPSASSQPAIQDPAMTIRKDALNVLRVKKAEHKNKTEWNTFSLFDHDND